ncbi:helix-turn-helix transcriptional regulator [Bacteroides sp. 51]|uniref:helix-turn-helix domain-containing protein n=1 Tax=Bacteroides sp. 51 TaxID=2302938 RepID=UPI0013CFD22D|nr:helix-turn-helix transcriptional regulator [Bacteroides sp. 51]NDV84750.1 XRE family transcriptional regulator [Bacteroides sp. 51]
MEDEKEIPQTSVHMGHNVTKFRQLKGIKQRVFAEMIGLANERAVYRLESKKVIERNILEIIALLLDVSVEILETLPEVSGNVIIENDTFEFDSGSTNVMPYGETTDDYDPIDKALEFFKEYLEEERKQKQELMKRIKELEELIRKGMK